MWKVIRGVQFSTVLRLHHSAQSRKHLRYLLIHPEKIHCIPSIVLGLGESAVERYTTVGKTTIFKLLCDTLNENKESYKYHLVRTEGLKEHELGQSC